MPITKSEVHFVLKVMHEPPNNMAICTMDNDTKLFLPDGPSASKDMALVTCHGCKKQMNNMMTLKMNMRSRVK